MAMRTQSQRTEEGPLEFTQAGVGIRALKYCVNGAESFCQSSERSQDVVSICRKSVEGS